MDCTKVKQDLDLLLDSEIGARERDEILRHIEDCTGCSDELKRLRTMSDSLRKSLPAEAPASLDGRVFAAMAAAVPVAEVRNEPAPFRLFAFPKLLFAGAAAALLVCSAVAFQLGKMSASESTASERGDREAGVTSAADAARNSVADQAPVIEERIVEVPVIREKVVTRTVYVYREPKDGNETGGALPAAASPGLQSLVREGEYQTQTDLSGFVPVSELKMKITRKDDLK